MPVDQAACPHHTISVQRLRPGDHAFLRYDNDATRWEIASVFVRTGLLLGEKVLALLDPEVPTAEALVRLGGHDPALAEARHSGQLVLTTMGELIHPDRRFTSERQWARLREETARAVEEGYTAARAFIDMAWVQALHMDVDGVMRRESRADHLFTGRAYSELCAYDGRRFSEEVLDAMCGAHPHNVLAGLGILRTIYADGSVRLIGDADLNTRLAFTEALRDGLSQTTRSRCLIVDLTRLHFLSIGCATDLLLLASDADGHDRIEVHCVPFQANTLRKLGAELVESLALVEVEVECGC
ncbi:MEDS domain-containing protein [Streptomyces gobiensis]|uniref:MEDS domain-containing protein n=1 Tax=Streptomyces gobiensis TaxID=2875706 RepID=UPI001E2EEB65|nr:MEDS domain-containing protein [Streptomyces gobiensis]UGY92696.1 MEDS domain-containing protein [Streptomyces gobiensis]